MSSPKLHSAPLKHQQHGMPTVIAQELRSYWPLSFAHSCATRQSGAREASHWLAADQVSVRDHLIGHRSIRYLRRPGHRCGGGGGQAGFFGNWPVFAVAMTTPGWTQPWQDSSNTCGFKNNFMTSSDFSPPLSTHLRSGRPCARNPYTYVAPLLSQALTHRPHTIHYKYT